MPRPEIEIPKVMTKAPDADRFTLVESSFWCMVLDTDVLDDEGRATVLMEGPSLMSLVRGFIDLGNAGARLEPVKPAVSNRYRVHVEQSLVEEYPAAGLNEPIVVAWSILDLVTGRTVHQLDGRNYVIGKELVSLANKGWKGINHDA